MLRCECSDPGCKACRGCCQDVASYTLWRVDMEDGSGTDFCEDCGSDAMESGVFSTEEVEWPRAGRS